MARIKVKVSPTGNKVKIKMRRNRIKVTVRPKFGRRSKKKKK